MLVFYYSIEAYQKKTYLVIRERSVIAGVSLMFTFVKKCMIGLRNQHIEHAFLETQIFKYFDTGVVLVGNARPLFRVYCVCFFKASSNLLVMIESMCVS